MTRGAEARALAREAGAASARRPVARPPVPLDSAVVFAPAGDLVPFALEAVASATANTRAEGQEFLPLASALSVEPVVSISPLEAAGQALEDLRQGSVTGVAVLQMRCPPVA